MRRLRAQRAGRVQGERQAEIGLETALVELVEDEQPHPRELGIGLEPSGEYAFGEDLDPGPRADPAIEADLVAHRLPDVLAEQVGHPGGRHAGRWTPRLQHQDGAPGQPAGVGEQEWDPGGLAGPGRRAEHRASGGQRTLEVGERRVDRERVPGGERLRSRAARPRWRPLTRMPLPRLRAASWSSGARSDLLLMSTLAFSSPLTQHLSLPCTA